MSRSLTKLFLAALALHISCAPVRAQSIDDVLDAQDYIEGLSELQLPEVLEHYLKSHPTDDPALQIQYKIALERMAMRQPSVTAVDRAKHLENIIALRDQLIQQNPHDDRRATWLADQSAAWLFEMFHVETSGATSLFGSPSPSQLETAKTAAKNAYDLAIQAEQALADVLLDIESQPGFVNDVSAQLHRQRLIDRERRRRIPLLRGISAAIHAELNIADESQRIALEEQAVATLAEVRERLDGPPACHAALYQALALVRLQRLEEAAAAIHYITEGERCDGDTKFVAQLVDIERAAAQGGPDAAIERIVTIEQSMRRLTLLQRVLLADQRFKWRRAAALTADPSNRASLMGVAYQSYLDLLDTKLDQPAEIVRAVVVSRIANVLDSSVDYDELPPLVMVALAESMARDPAGRTQAVTILEGILKQPGVSPQEKSITLFTLGRVLYEDNRDLGASQRFLELARDYPTDSQAARAAELAAAIALELSELQPSSMEVRRLLNDAVKLLLERFPESRDIDRWRYVAGELAVRERRYDDAAAQFAAVPPTSKNYYDAQFMLARVARLSAEAERDKLKRITLNEKVVQTVRTVRAVIEQGAQSAAGDARQRKSLEEYLLSLDVLEAQAKLDLTDAQGALEVLHSIELNENVRPDTRADVLLARIKAYQALGRSGEAQQQLQRYLDAAPDQISAVLPPMMLGIETEVRELMDFGLLDEAKARAHSDLLPLANLLSKWLAENPQWRGDEFQLRRRMAAAFELSGSYADALKEYNRLLATHPDLMALLIGKAECLYQLGETEQLAESIALFKRIGAAERDTTSDTYWMSQLRMLQILDKVNRNTDQILPRIEQLEQRDPTLGGPQWQPGFNELRRKHRR